MFGGGIDTEHATLQYKLIRPNGNQCVTSLISFSNLYKSNSWIVILTQLIHCDSVGFRLTEDSRQALIGFPFRRRYS